MPASLPGNRSKYGFNALPMGGARLIPHAFFRRLEQIGIFIYGSGAVLYTELTHQSQRVDLHDAVSKKWHIPVNVQTLIHRGRRVNAVESLAHQGIVHGSNLFLMTRAKGGGKNNISHGGENLSSQGMNMSFWND